MPAKLGSRKDAEEQGCLLVGERLSTLRPQDFGAVEMNASAHEAFTHEGDGGRRAHDDAHVPVNLTHAAKARESAGGLRGVMGAVVRHHRAEGIKEECCLEEPFTPDSGGVEASVSIDAVTDFGRVQHAAERDPLPPRATVLTLGVGADGAADCRAGVAHETSSEHARVARTERVFRRVALEEHEQVGGV